MKIRLRFRGFVAFGFAAICLVFSSAAIGESDFRSVAMREWMGYALDTSLANSNVLLFAAETERRVARMASELFEAAGFGTAPRVRIVNSSEINAVGGPGGVIYVTAGLVDSLEDDELYAILAHEIVHILQRHGEVRFGELKASAYRAGVVAGFVVGLTSAVITQGLLPPVGPAASPTAQLSTYIGRQTLYRGVATPLLKAAVPAAAAAVVRAFAERSREQEIEADRGAVDILIRAGRDPRALLRVFSRWKQYEVARENQGVHVGEAVLTASHFLPPGLSLGERTNALRVYLEGLGVAASPPG